MLSLIPTLLHTLWHAIRTSFYIFNWPSAHARRCNENKAPHLSIDNFPDSLITHKSLIQFLFYCCIPPGCPGSLNKNKIEMRPNQAYETVSLPHPSRPAAQVHTNPCPAYENSYLWAWMFWMWNHSWSCITLQCVFIPLSLWFFVLLALWLIVHCAFSFFIMYNYLKNMRISVWYACLSKKHLLSS